MKQSLQLRLGQQLTMTPQLQQAIRLLQLSTLELELEVQQALDSNLMLELAEEGEEEGDLPERENTAPEESDSQPESYDEPDPELERVQDAIPDELPVDSAWDDIYEMVGTGGPAPDDDDRPFEYGDSASESLREHLLWQLQMGSFSETDLEIAESIIDAVDDDGFLSVPLESIHEGLLAQGLEVEADEVEAVLHAVQNFDPAGVCARDLRESLLLQLRQIDPDTPWREEALLLVGDWFEALAARDFNLIRRRLRLEDDDIAAVLRLIQSLNPRPGGHISSSKTEYIVPDVIVRKYKGAWRVELNPEAAPRLRVNATYANLIKQVSNPSESATLRNHLQEARWFIKSLQSRNETLLKVATAIVERQRDFLEQGEVAMKALVLHDIAETVEMHESTISRVTTRKYMHTPRGIFELKYFFSSHVGTADGGEASSTAIRALIKQLVGEENGAKPLSDSKIATILAEKGINVARRTVAKYREAMAIPPSNERKRLA